MSIARTTIIIIMDEMIFLVFLLNFMLTPLSFSRYPAIPVSHHYFQETDIFINQHLSF